MKSKQIGERVDNSLKIELGKTIGCEVVTARGC